MEITIQNLINSKKFDGMNLIAGKNGLNRAVTGCGILDYELDSILNEKYLYNNFYEGQFVLTTFLYAKNDEHLIGEAVKYLVEKKVSCLAIKNIYRIPISEYVLRYADSKDFPIFIVESLHLFFEDIIINVDNFINNVKKIDYGHREIDSILNKPLDNISIKNYVYEINPSLYNHYITIYFNYNKRLTLNRSEEFIDKYKNSTLNTPFTSVLSYRNGFMLIYSCDAIDKNQLEILANKVVNILAGSKNDFAIGVSEIHHHLHEMKQSLSESIYSSLLNMESVDLFTLYKSLGSYQVIFPYAKDNQMQLFSNKVLNKINDYDAENKSNLTETLMELIKHSGNLNELAQYLSLHENTVRNRLEKIEDLTGLSFRKPEHYEQLALTVKIHKCGLLLDKFENI